MGGVRRVGGVGGVDGCGGAALAVAPMPARGPPPCHEVTPMLPGHPHAARSAPMLPGCPPMLPDLPPARGVPRAREAAPAPGGGGGVGWSPRAAFWGGEVTPWLVVTPLLTPGRLLLSPGAQRAACLCCLLACLPACALQPPICRFPAGFVHPNIFPQGNGGCSGGRNSRCGCIGCSGGQQGQGVPRPQRQPHCVQLNSIFLV